ncbi:sigma-54-dependent transcriptional regulator [Enterovibrio nigricans]|uniref:DNA-binding transcriptional response regulator, NtrC family, contains REC, AAA-type ATPase, and a Fis-type DNA-binding domains n=1 Tax=Enterovibrio nigricans DSM 22720 TaxID=1121868 RepID=A0A1T4UJL2_9GAMM|nr:sigma-54 dependent transcriptional regulator [Enterovibrio nigricans]SKA52982.1 DNA-binding transcriptional response regulator, NtrC family, contains REC, AAA-type ATPase, and a Fis-type DNA-binding domains [Enterovibrio nigricans DSM 22720]
MKKTDILLVEPNENIALSVIDVLKEAGYQVKHARTGRSALLGEPATISLVSSSLPDMSVRDWVACHQRQQSKGVAIAIVEHDEGLLAAETMKAGATDYLLKPFEATQLLNLLQRVEALGRPMANIVAESWRSKQVLQLAHRAACTRASVLITGESGTGKEVLARYVHENSSRNQGPFIAVNCAAIPESMLEAVLFGHVKGAFTGALQSQTGKFEEANGGTILLDEIGEMSPAVQAKLLRVLQEREVERVGSHKAIQLDIRVIAATNKDLRLEVQKGTFREDLYYRLDVLPLHWPPLRERQEDILPISRFFIEKYQDGSKCHLAPDALSALSQYEWPGNIRELENVIQRALVMRHGDYITAQDLMLPEGASGGMQVVNRTEHLGHVEAKKHAEFQFVLEKLRQFGGNRTKTADALGVTTRALRYKLAAMREQGIDLQSALGLAA